MRLAKDYKYLGLWLQSNCRYTTHYRQLLVKANRVAYLIRRVITPGNPPRIPIIVALVRAILIPVIAYGIPFLRPNKEQLGQLDTILAKVVRPAMGLPGTAPTLSTLVEVGLPSTIFLRRSALLHLFRRFAKLPSTHPSSQTFRMELRRPRSRTKTFRSLVEELNEVERVSGVTHDAPNLDNMVRHAKAATFAWWKSTGQKRRLQRLLPTLDVDTPPYYYVDDRTTASYRCRLRFNLALLRDSKFKRHLARSPMCRWCPGKMETPRHFLLKCPEFCYERFQLEMELRWSNVDLSLPTILGHLPALPIGLKRDVLRHTGRYISRICRRRRC